MSLDHEVLWQNDTGLINCAHIYGVANLYYGFSEGTRVNVANTQFFQEQERLWGGVGIGGSYNWNDDKWRGSRQYQPKQLWRQLHAQGQYRLPHEVVEAN